MAKKARHVVVSPQTAKDELLNKFLQAMNHFLGGSGDLEQEDARDVVDFFEEELASDHAKTQFKQRMMNHGGPSH